MGKLRFGAKITNEPAEVHTGAGALKIFNNISAQLRVEPFKRMDTYGDNTYTFWLYIYGVRGDPQFPQTSILEKANVAGAGEWRVSFVPIIYLTDPGQSLIYIFGGEGVANKIEAVGPGGKGQKFQLKQWYHIAGVKTDSDLIIYIDGKEEARYKVLQRDFLQGKGHLRIGATQTRSASFAMDEFGLYDRALTEKEVQTVFKGISLSVESQAKLTTTWGHLKTSH